MQVSWIQLDTCMRINFVFKYHGYLMDSSVSQGILDAAKTGNVDRLKEIIKNNSSTDINSVKDDVRDFNQILRKHYMNIANHLL